MKKSWTRKCTFFLSICLVLLVAGCGDVEPTSIAETCEGVVEVGELLGIEITVDLKSCEAGLLSPMIGGTIRFACFEPRDSDQIDAIIEMLGEEKGAPNSAADNATNMDLPSELFDAPKQFFGNSPVTTRWETLDRSDDHFVRQSNGNYYHLAIDTENNRVFYSCWMGTSPR